MFDEKIVLLLPEPEDEDEEPEEEAGDDAPGGLNDIALSDVE